MSGPDEQDAGLDPVEVRRLAMDLLARREHTKVELVRKLSARDMAGPVVDEVLEALAAENLQSDERFAESFVAARAGKGQGPVRIRAELRDRGVDAALMDTALDGGDHDWVALARAARRKKFGPAEPEELRDRARQMQFLGYRGFTSEQVRAALADWDLDP